MLLIVCLRGFTKFSTSESSKKNVCIIDTIYTGTHAHTHAHTAGTQASCYKTTYIKTTNMHLYKLETQFILYKQNSVVVAAITVYGEVTMAL